MIWIIAIAIIGFIAFKFFSDFNKDKEDLERTTLDKKFKVIIDLINETAFNGRAKIIELGLYSVNLHQNGKNQLVNFTYAAGHLTITWKYKFYQKEVVHEKVFYDVRNLSIFEQQKVAETMINEMGQIIQKHQNNVLGG